MGVRRTFPPLAALRSSWFGAVAMVALACGAEAPNANEDGVVAAPAEGGQTGSAGCDNPPDCVCDVVGGASIVRGVVTQSQPSQVHVKVTEVYGTTAVEIATGATLGGSFVVGQPCGLGDVAPPALGLDVFVAFDPGPVDGERLLQGWLQLMPFEDPLPITNEKPLASEDFAVLLDDSACREHFGSDEPFVCEETF